MKGLLFPTLLWLSTKATASLFPGYVSLSIEFSRFPNFTGSASAPNEFSKNLVQNLASLQNSPLSIRVGGTSADHGILESSQTDPVILKCNGGSDDCIAKDYFDSFSSFPNGTLYSFDFNLGNYDTAGWQTLQKVVPLACKALEGKLNVFEVGNEPDLYIGQGRRKSGWTTTDYVNEWYNTTTHIKDYIHQACPSLDGKFKYMFPSLAGTHASSSPWQIPDLYKIGGSKLGSVSQISVHNYMGSVGANKADTLQHNLMNHTFVKHKIEEHVTIANSLNGVTTADYIIGEHNSLAGGGANGTSDTFGAALWALEFASQAASTGVIKRLHYHQGLNSPYSGWVPVSPIRTNAPYYGLLAASDFLQDSNTITVKEISLGGRTDVNSGYGTYVSGTLKRIALLNLLEWDSGTRGQQTYTVKVTPSSSWTIKRLVADGARMTSGVTYNGYAFDAATNGKGKAVQGRATNEKITADANGNLKVTVPDTEAVIAFAN